MLLCNSTCRLSVFAAQDKLHYVSTNLCSAALLANTNTITVSYERKHLILSSTLVSNFAYLIWRCNFTHNFTSLITPIVSKKRRFRILHIVLKNRRVIVGTCFNGKQICYTRYVWSTIGISITMLEYILYFTRLRSTVLHVFAY